MYLPKQIRGFTIVELLVVIAIIGILGLAGNIAYNEVQKATRDDVRVTELDQVSLALAAYKSEYGNYPSETDFGTYNPADFCDTAEVIVNDAAVTDCNNFVTGTDNINDVLRNVMSNVPQDPLHGDSGAASGAASGDDYFYYYHPRLTCDNGAGYDIVAVVAHQMETEKYTNVGELQSGVCPDLPVGLQGITNDSYIKVIDYLL